MPSYSHSLPRRVPRQPRGRRRVARLLRAADLVIGQAGYEASTMCAIASRAGSSVGSLYQFFPNKEAVAKALRSRYAQEYAEFWRRLTPQAAGLAPEPLADQIIDFPLRLAARHPGFLPLFDAPRPTSQSRWRRTICRLTADALRAWRPRLSQSDAIRIASVVHQIVKGLLTLYARAGAKEKPAVVTEFRMLLASYLRTRLGN